MKENQNPKSKIALKEEETLKFWQENKIFEETLEKNKSKGKDFVFYEGPPTANGKPGIHHLEARAYKDVIPRYKTMQGYSVRRKAGWDTHGLPVELQVEKELGFKSKIEIEKYGIAPFNKKCKESVLQYIDLWGKFTDRIGYWVDKKDAYFTFDSNYTESVWNIFKKVDEQNLLYKDYKIVPWCPRCGTTLSSHELAQGYQDDKDLTVYAKFKLTADSARIIHGTDAENVFLIAWTTTPWTLPGNVALAINEKIIYCKVKILNVKIKSESQNSKVDTKEVYIVAKERVEDVFKEYDFEIIEELKGKDLVGLEYEPLYPFLKDNLPESEKGKLEKAFKVYSADFVTTEDGTGIVHIAPMYGTDDFELGTKVGLPKFHLVKVDGTFIDETGFLAGKFVKDEEVAVDIIKDLANRPEGSLLFHKEKHTHSYPHCWRCKTPLIYFARDSWYIRMSSLRDKLISENENINWEPNYIKEGRFGEWLKDIKDWAISRERYWGTPLPIWISEDGTEKLVVDSVATLKKYTKKSANKYFLMRHGEATQNVEDVLSSDNKVKHPLTAKGKEQAILSAKKLKDEKIDLIIHSPLMRTKETAEEVKKIIGDVEIIEDERIREEGFGELSDVLNSSNFSEYFPTFEDRLSSVISGCESLREVKQRVGDFLYDIEKKYQGKNILIITHSGPMKLMLSVAEGAEEIALKEIYNPGVEFLKTGEFAPFPFVSLPHNEKHELDLHKPYIDEVELVSDSGKSLKRVKEVCDVWFDSGAMPFAQDHYPFENKEFIDSKKGYPADFISEAIDQTRGWFYTLHAIGVLMGKGNAYKNVICLGHLMDKNGKKMSKSLGNIIDPWEQMDKYGADAIRLWMYSVNQPGESKNYDEKTVDEIVKKNFNLLSNVLTFYELYRDKELESNEYPKKFLQRENVLDLWILARLSELVGEATKNLDNYKILEPVRALREFIDDLSTWYVRRSRERLRDNDKDAKRTLYFILKTISKYMAPFAPFYAEDLYQKIRLENDLKSVHLESWPTGYLEQAQSMVGRPQELVASEIIEEMKKVREVCSLGLKARSDAKINVRQPLKELRVKSLELRVEYKEIIKEEINVKEVILDSLIQNEVLLDTEITLELKEEGVIREFMRAIQDLRKEKGFEAKDRAVLTVVSDDNFKKIISKFESEIKKVTGLDAIEFALDAEKEVGLEGYAIKVSIVKL
ncbi:MAG: class I tRNA ligase family protein [Candidatus Paceibacterota bacterium]